MAAALPQPQSARRPGQARQRRGIGADAILARSVQVLGHEPVRQQPTLAFVAATAAEYSSAAAL